MGMNILRTAVRQRDPALHQRGMHSHFATKPRMPRIPDFSDFNNIGVVLLTCITERELIWHSRRIVRSRAVCNRWLRARLSLSRRLAAFIIVTSEGPPDKSGRETIQARWNTAGKHPLVLFVAPTDRTTSGRDLQIRYSAVPLKTNREERGRLFLSGNSFGNFENDNVFSQTTTDTP